MSLLQLAHLCAYVGLAVLAWLIARRTRGFLPVAFFVTWMAVQDLRPLLLAPLRAKVLHGHAFVALRGLDRAFALSWGMFFLAACVAAFLERRVRHLLGAWLALSLAVVRLPTEAWNRVYVAEEVASFAATWGCIGWAFFRHRAFRLRPDHLILLLYAAVDVAINAVRLGVGLRAQWHLVEVANLLLLASCICLSARWLGRRQDAW